MHCRNSGWVHMESVDRLGRLDILVVVCLLVQDYSESLHLFVAFKFVSAIFCSFLCSGSVHLSLDLCPSVSYMLLQVLFKSSIWLLLVHRNVTEVFILILYPATSLYSLISSSHCFVYHRRFSMYTMSAKENRFTTFSSGFLLLSFFFLPYCMN